MRILIRSVLTPVALGRLALGWLSVGLAAVFAPHLAGPLSTPMLWLLLAGIVVVVTICAFGVVTEAEHLADRLGDPYGTLVLTLSIAAIEVILISSVMLGPGEHATIARDSVMAVSMIILNLVVGVALVVGALRRPGALFNRRGVTSYLVMLVLLLGVAFALPAVIGTAGAYSPAQAITVAVLTAGVYALFLARQLGARRTDFQEPLTGRSVAQSPHARGPIAAVLRAHRGELTARILLLIALVVPIVLLSHDMAALLDDGLDRAGAPVALSGILIAMIVFLPETITTVRAALLGEMQRVSNLCHGALVSTVGLTIPAVLTVGVLTDRPVVLAESPIALLLLAVTLVVTTFTVATGRARAVGGAVHLALFGGYLVSVFV